MKVLIDECASRTTYVVFSLVLLGVACRAQSASDIPSLFGKLNQAKTTDRASRQILEAASKDASAREYVVQRFSGMIEKPVSERTGMTIASFYPAIGCVIMGAIIGAMLPRA